MKTTLRIILLMFAILTSSAHATIQYPDKIIFDGKEYDLYTHLMEHYFSRFPNKRPMDGIRTTASRRGYVATYAIKKNNLVLIDIEIEIYNKTKDKKRNTLWKSVKDEFIPQRSFLIDWFTGILELPYGKRDYSRYTRYGAAHSNYIVLEVNKGRLIRKHNFDYKQYEELKNQ